MSQQENRKTCLRYHSLVYATCSALFTKFLVANSIWMKIEKSVVQERNFSRGEHTEHNLQKPLSFGGHKTWSCQYGLELFGECCWNKTDGLYFEMFSLKTKTWHAKCLLVTWSIIQKTTCRLRVFFPSADRCHYLALSRHYCFPLFLPFPLNVGLTITSPISYFVVTISLHHRSHNREFDALTRVSPSEANPIDWYFYPSFFLFGRCCGDNRAQVSRALRYFPSELGRWQPPRGDEVQTAAIKANDERGIGIAIAGNGCVTGLPGQGIPFTETASSRFGLPSWLV